MVVKVYISGISGNKEVKKRQQRVSMILDSKCIKYEIIDITEPGREVDKEFMQNNAKSNGGTVSDPNPRSPLPPQLFNDEEYCGDYDEFDLANEIDTLEQFLKVEAPPEVPQSESEKEKAVNGDVLQEISQESDAKDVEEPVANEESAKEGTPVKEETPVKEASPAKEGTPLRESSNEPNDEQAKGDSPKETTPERQKSIEKEELATEKAESPAKEVEPKASKEDTPEKEESVNANGTVSSHDESEEKDDVLDEPTVERKKDPSEALIQSEQTVAAE